MGGDHQSALSGADAASARGDAPSAEDASFDGSSNAEVDGAMTSPVPVDATMVDVAALDGVADVQPGIDVMGDSVCPADMPLPIGEPGEVPIQASIVGPNVSATLCTNAYVAYENASTMGPNSFAVNGNPAGYPPYDFPQGNPPIAFVLPMDAVGGSLSAGIPISASAPGTYESDAGTCGSVQFVIEFPVPSSVDCDSGIIGSNVCPDGCAMKYGHKIVIGCEPEYPSIEYLASDECDGQAGQGSYTLTITSPVPPAEAGILYAAVHGTLNATVVNVDGGAGTAEIQATF